MLCFIHALNGETDDDGKVKNFKYKLLKKTRSPSCKVDAMKMVANNKSLHTRSQSATVVPQNNSNLNNSGGTENQNSNNQNQNNVGGKKTLSVSPSSVSLQMQNKSSPNHQNQSIFSKNDKASLKFLSTSSPAMTASLVAPPSPNNNSGTGGEKKEKVHSTSKSREKKFHRHFPSVDDEEKVLNYYSCALVGDILLQGNLYITKNYFAFYSNVFGYVTKLLIPIVSVEKITKEKTARIIPNAVGISTNNEEKHVFGSLMSRDNTFKYMTKVWHLNMEKCKEIVGENDENVVNFPQIIDMVEIQPEIIQNNSEMSDYSTETKCNESEKENINNNNNNDTLKIVEFENSKHTLTIFKQKFLAGYKDFLELPTGTVVLLTATFLVLLLFLSAIVLIYRLNKVQDKYVTVLEENVGDIHEELLRFSMNLHVKSASSVDNFVDLNLQQIVKLRKELEALSSILLPKVKGLDADAKNEI